MRSSAIESGDSETRRQFGTILYTDKDSFGKKMPRKMEVYLPQVPEDGNSIQSWKDTGIDKKGKVAEEYQRQKSSSSISPGGEAAIMRFNSKDGDTSEFEGRRCQPSKKNFRLTDSFGGSQIYL